MKELKPGGRSPRRKIIPASSIVLCLFALFPGAGGQTGSGYPAAASESSTGATRISSPSNQSPFSGSVAQGKATPEVVPLTFQDAIELGLKNNLGVLLQSYNTIAARGQKWKELSALLPNLTAGLSENVVQENLAAQGLRFPGFPTVVGPFGFTDARVYLSQTILNLKALNRERGAGEDERAAHYSYKDARDLVVLATGNAYLQALADAARLETAEAQVKNAQALYDKAVDQQNAGLSPAIDTLRARVELQTRQQQLIQAKNNFAIQKLTVARVIGLAPGQEFDLTDKSPYQPSEDITVDEALKRAYASRSDYQAAMTDVRAAEFSRRAAVAGYLPSLSFNADYGLAGSHPSTARPVADVRGTLSIPIFRGGSVHADVLQADARLEQSRDRLDNLRTQIDSDVRAALLNLQSAADQVNVARSNIDLAEETLTQSRDRFSAGVTDTVEVVQSQEAVSSAHEQYISSLYSYNYAKISLVRALGIAEQGVKEFFRGK